MEVEAEEAEAFTEGAVVDFTEGAVEARMPVAARAAEASVQEHHHLQAGLGHIHDPCPGCHPDSEQARQGDPAVMAHRSPETKEGHQAASGLLRLPRWRAP